MFLAKAKMAEMIGKTDDDIFHAEDKDSAARLEIHNKDREVLRNKIAIRINPLNSDVHPEHLVNILQIAEYEMLFKRQVRTWL